MEQQPTMMKRELKPMNGVDTPTLFATINAVSQQRDLAVAVARAEPAGELKAFSGVEGFLRQSWGPGWALVGDAGYFKDPITAHGISDALRDAELLARAVTEGSDRALARYQARRDELSVGLLEITDAVASFDWTLDEVQQLHLDLSAEMSREVETIVGLDGPASAEAVMVLSFVRSRFQRGRSRVITFHYVGW